MNTFVFSPGDMVVPYICHDSLDLVYWSVGKDLARSHVGHYIKVKACFTTANGRNYYLASNSYYFEDELLSKADYQEMKKVCSKSVKKKEFLELL